MRETRSGNSKGSVNSFVAVFCIGRTLETFALFVTAAFLVEYNAPIVMTSSILMFGSGLMLCGYKDARNVVARLHLKHMARTTVCAIHLANKTMCCLAGLKYSGAYRYVLFTFMTRSPINPFSICFRSSRVGAPDARGAISVTVCLLVVAILGSVSDFNAGDAESWRFPSPLLGFFLMLAASLFELMHTRTLKRLTTQKKFNSKAVYATLLITAAMLLLPLGIFSRIIGFTEPVEMGNVQFIFAILFITTFTTVLNFYTGNIGSRALKSQALLPDYITSALVASALDFIQQAESWTMYSACLSLIVYYGIRMPLSKESNDCLPMYNPSKLDSSSK